VVSQRESEKFVIVIDFDDILIGEGDEDAEIKELIRPFSKELVANLQEMRQC
jgi:hypothetical protein